METVIAELGLDLTVKEFVEKVRNDPENYFGWVERFFYSSIQNKCALSQGRQKLFWVHKLCTPVLVLSQRRKVLQCTTPRDVKVDILLLKVKAKSIQRE